MPLNYTPKGGSTANAPTPQTTSRPQINYGQPKASTARVDALKGKLTGKPAPQPAPPRKAGSSARAEQFGALQKFGLPPGSPQPVPVPTKNVQGGNLQNEAPPPSGLRHAPELSQVDTSVDGQTAAEAPSEPLSPQFAALAKQERMIRKARQELQAERAALKQEREGMVSKSALQADPLKALSEAGVSYDQLVELQLNQAAPDPNQALLSKIAELEAKLAGVDEKFVARDKQSYDAAVNQIRNDVKLLVDSDAAFETIKATEQSEEVVELIKKVFDVDGEILPVEEACRLVEEKLVEREFARVERLTKLQKIRQRMTPPSETEEANPAEATAPRTTTLTNNGSVQQTLTARQRAIDAFNRAKS